MAQLPPNSVALYRVCTEKSRLGFGRFGDMTVGDILRTKPDYIAFVYYSCAKVSFRDEILDALGLERIAKPGTDPEALKRWNAALYDALRGNFTDDQRRNYFLVKYNKNKARARKALARREAADDRYTSAAHLQAINHGHIK